MIEMSVTPRGKFLGMLEGFRRILRRKGSEAAEEIGEQEHPEPRTEADEALHLAMGWAEQDGDDSLKVVRKKVKEALEA